MKKIVALVLTLVLALSLATVAFAKPDDPAKLEVGDVYEVTDGDISGKALEAGATFKAAKAPADEKPGNVAYYVINGTNYVACDADDAAMAVYTASGWVFLKVADVEYTVVATKLAKDKCVNKGDQLYSYVNDEGKTVYAVKDNAPKAPADVVSALVGSEVLKLKKVELKATHSFKAATYDKDGMTVLTYKCENCAVTAKVATAAEFLAADESLRFEGNLIMSAAVAAGAAATTTGVSSAKTFDAGVALYAGMALMSVAGSAVVIGKKKEF